MIVKVGYSKERDKYAFSTKGDVEEIRFKSIGADDEMANTMFVIEIDGNREKTLRPEPAIVHLLKGLAESKSFLLFYGPSGKREIPIDKGRRNHLQQVAREIEEGLEDSPLGQ
jgi:CRISPR/Cas system-associated exonuclease Cas4 (RecB family)